MPVSPEQRRQRLDAIIWICDQVSYDLDNFLGWHREQRHHFRPDVDELLQFGQRKVSFGDSIKSSIPNSHEIIGMAMERSSRVSFGRFEQRHASWLRNLSCRCKRFTVSDTRRNLRTRYPL